MTFIIENEAEWQQAFARQADALGADAERSLVELGNDIQQREKASGPKGEGRHAVDDITVETSRSDGTFVVDVGPNVATGFYLGFYEFGTQDQPPRPFMRPAVAAAVANWKP